MEKLDEETIKAEKKVLVANGKKLLDLMTAKKELLNTKEHDLNAARVALTQAET